MCTPHVASQPVKTQILVIGGGPGGSYTATLLARGKFFDDCSFETDRWLTPTAENFDVTLLEKDRFPRFLFFQLPNCSSMTMITTRYHIGESFLPSIPHYLSIIDAYDLFETQKYYYKVCIQTDQKPLLWWTTFSQEQPWNSINIAASHVRADLVN